MWNDPNGWHIRATGDSPDGQAPPKMSGTITSTSKIPGLATMKPDAKAGTVSITDNKITFELMVGATPVGFDFGVGCSADAVKFELMSVMGGLQPADSIYTGQSSKAVENPFVAHRSS